VTIVSKGQPAYVETSGQPLMHNAKTSRRSNTPLNSVRRRLNDQVSHVVVAIVVLSPFFYGSNRPFFWLLWSVLTGVVGIWLFVQMGRTEETFRISFKRMLPVLIPFVTLALYMVVQIIPFGTIVPAFMPSNGSSAIYSTTLSLTPQDTLLALIRWLTYGLLFFFTLQFCSNASRARRFLNVVFWAIVFHAVVGLALRYQFGDTIFGIEKLYHKGSTTGGFVNRNSFATFLSFGAVLGLVAMLAQWMDDSAVARRTLFDRIFNRDGFLPVITGWGVIVVTLISTNSRMGVFAGCCGMLVVVILTLCKMPLKDRASGLRFAIIILPAVLGIGVVLYGQSFLERIGQLDTTDDIGIRFELYRQTFTMIKNRYLLGYGGQSYEYAFPLFHDMSFAVHLLWDKAHSTYLTLWAEYGVIFGSMPLVLIAVVFIGTFRAFWTGRMSDPRMLAGLGAITVAGIHSLVDFSLEIEAVTFAFTVIIAASYSRALDARPLERLQ
jgi:hypothetical protein